MKRNKEFIINGILMIFKRNYGLKIDTHEIDLKLSLPENFVVLHDRYITGKDYDISEL